MTGAPYYSDATVTLHHGQALDVLREMPRGSVDCCVTSPPYWGLRDYDMDGQLGSEPTPGEYVERLRDILREVRRTLTYDGTLWLNLGDSYSTRVVVKKSSHQAGLGFVSDDLRKSWVEQRADGRTRMPAGTGLPEKNLIGVPWRVAFALQDDGWILRSEIIWAKRNCMPDPAPDRPARAHEQVFLFAKSHRYWYDSDAIRDKSDPDQEAHNQRYAKTYDIHTECASTTGQPGKGGRNARDVWSISAQPFSGKHFAVMPPALADRCIKAGCKPGGTVLDPFSGSGTTGMVAQKNGRKYIGIDLNADYLDLSLRTRLANQTIEFPA
jgi:DNA modification methylase